VKGRKLRAGAAKVLVVKRDGLRAFVEAEPAFAAIRNAHPDATIDLVTSPDLQRLAKCAPFFDRVVATKPEMPAEERKAFARSLKKLGYGVAYDLDGTKQSMELRSALSGFRAPTWVGARRPVNHSTKSLAPSPLAGPGMRKLLKDAGLEPEQRLADFSWSTDPANGSANLDPSWFGISGPFALFLPAANASLRWPARHFGEVAASLGQEGLTPVILGHAELGPYAYDVMQHAAEITRSTGRAAVDLSGKADAAQMAVLARHASFFVAGPSEELHLVAAVGTPGIVTIPASRDMEDCALYGRQVVKLTAGQTEAIEPELVLQMLSNMGLLHFASPKGRAYG
jgi:ADP-heptose:LPS heptosyltransferase